MFTAQLRGDKELVQRIATLPVAVQAALKVKLDSLSIKLQKHVVNDKLHGQVLKQRSGALARSIHQEVLVADTSVYGRVFSSGDVRYGAFWEYGFTGTESVRAFDRLVKAEGLNRGFKLVQPVRAHTRQVNQAPRSFLRSAFADMREEIAAGMKQAALDGARRALMDGRP